MATLVQIAGLSEAEVKEIDQYGDAVAKASSHLDEVIQEVMGLSKNPKVTRPKLNERQEKVLIFHMGVLATRVVQGKC